MRTSYLVCPKKNPHVFAHLSVVASVQSHSMLPEVLEEGGQDLCLNVISFYTIRAATLFHHL